MKSKRLSTVLPLILSLLALLAVSGCDNVGIFATIAVSDVIEEGLLPEGISPSKVVHVNNGNLDNYDFFSSGPTLWYRNITDRSDVPVAARWQSLELVDTDGTEWDAVQSITESNNRIVLTLAREPGSADLQVGLFFFDNFLSSSRVNLTPFSGALWTSTSSSYKTARIFDPDPSDTTAYLNVLNYTGSFADSDTVFSGSSMYTVDPTNELTSPVLQGAPWSTNLTNRMVTSAAYSGTEHVFTLARFLEISSGDGMLVNDGGVDITPGNISVPVTGVTWLPDVGAFILGAQSLTTAGGAYSSSVYAVFGGNANATVWTAVPGASDNFRLRSFLDVSATTAGDPGGLEIVLGGSASFAAASSNNEGVGYVEIQTNASNDPANWTITNNDASFVFAFANNYTVSDLRSASIDGFYKSSAPTMADYVYASARSLGIWRADANTTDPSWARE